MRAFNLASDAYVTMADLAAQALAARHDRADYITIEIGENDLCGSTPIATFRTELKHGLAVLEGGTHAKRIPPKILLLSIENIVAHWRVLHAEPNCTKSLQVRLQPRLRPRRPSPSLLAHPDPSSRQRPQHRRSRGMQQRPLLPLRRRHLLPPAPPSTLLLARRLPTPLTRRATRPRRRRMEDRPQDPLRLMYEPGVFRRVSRSAQPLPTGRAAPAPGSPAVRPVPRQVVARRQRARQDARPADVLDRVLRERPQSNSGGRQPEHGCLDTGAGRGRVGRTAFHVVTRSHCDGLTKAVAASRTGSCRPRQSGATARTSATGRRGH